MGLSDCSDKEAFLIAGFDLCVHIFHRSFAEIMFPVVHHGSGRSMWYAHWVCHTLFPRKQLCFTSVSYQNTRGDPHEDRSLPQFVEHQKIVKLFNQSVICESKVWEQPKQIRMTNMMLLRDFDGFSSRRPCREEVQFSARDLGSIYDVENSAFVSKSVRGTSIRRVASKPSPHRVVYFVHHKLECVYAVVPKCGSRTILLRMGIELPDIKERALSEGLSFCSKHRIKHFKNGNISGFCKKTDDLIWERKRKLTPDDTKYWTFTFVREPAERIASAYRDFFFKRRQPEELSAHFSQNNTLSELVDYVCKTPDLHLDRHLKSQSENLKIGQAPPLDFIGKLENFEQDWGIISNKIGCEGERKTDSLNITLKNSESSFLSLQDRKKLEIRYEDDFKNFGYAKMHGDV